MFIQHQKYYQGLEYSDWFLEKLGKRKIPSNLYKKLRTHTHTEIRYCVSIALVLSVR